MIFYYAIGGGLGHVTRACAVLHTLHPQVPAVILCSALCVPSFPLPDGIRLQIVPSAFARDSNAYKTWLMQLFAALRPQVVFLDTFPVGITGEFCDFPALNELPVYYVARRLRWSMYAHQVCGRAPRIDTTFCLEPLEAAHQGFVDHCSRSVTSLSLRDPPEQLSDSEHATLSRLSALAEPFWLTVHSGGKEEVRDLVAYAEEMRLHEGTRVRLIVVTPERNVPASSPSDQTLGFFPAQTLFPFAERVISACGFNIMRQMEPFRQKHYYMPFARRFDDQYWRAAYWRQN